METNEIIKVKIQGQGYLVNDTMSVPKADGNRHYELVKEWLLTNTPEPEFTPEQLDAQRIAQIKSKASELITSKYSIIWQLNHPRTDTAYEVDYAYIDNIRIISNESEVSGIALEDIDWRVL